ncbi:hypothetical protein J3R83DRAFT_13545, partial [Lanmaoa asiatica]
IVLETFLGMLVQYSATLSSLQQHLTALGKPTSSLAVDVLSDCLRERAVELPRRGGVLWSSLPCVLRLRTVIASSQAGKLLAYKFTQLTPLIRNGFDSFGTDRHDRVCHLNVKLQRVATHARH